MAKTQIIELKDGKIFTSTFKNNVLLASVAPEILVTDANVVMGCTVITTEAFDALYAARQAGRYGKIQEGFVVQDQRAVEKVKGVELEKVLTRWEGAVSATERDGDDSPEAEKELTESRAALLEVLKRALGGTI